MSGAFKFDPIETEMIVRMYKQRMSSRQIAKVLDRPIVEIHRYITEVVVKQAQKQKAAKIIAPSLAKDPPPMRGLRRYDDPMAAVEGSQKLLEAVHRYLLKHKGANP